MPESYTQLYVHLVWATWDRLPLITPAVEPHLHAAVAEKCRELRCTPLAIGGIADHLHVLVRLHSTVAVATLAKELKGSSSHLITHEVAPGQFFKWQGSYGAFTLDGAGVRRVESYVARQKQHHALGDLRDEWERTAAPDSDASG